MKKAAIIFLISIISLLLIFLATISFALWFVFTPEKLTPIVQKEAAKYLTCKSEIGKVEPTFFTTFPAFGLKIDHFVLINPVKGSPNDTLVNITQLVGIVDAKAWWKNDEIKINELLLKDGSITIFYDSLGNSNYDIFPPDTTAETASKPFAVAMKNIDLKNINFSYIDHTMALAADLRNLTGNVNGTYISDTFSGDIVVDKSNVSLNYDGEKYLDNVSTRLNMVADFTYPHLMIKLKEVSGTLNDIPVQANGFFGDDSLGKDLIFDITYNVESSPVDQLLKMAPPSYKHYFEGMDIKGDLAIEGKIDGIYGDSVMPMFTNRLLLKDGTLTYQGFPIQMHDMSGDVTIATDAMTDSKTYTRIDRFEAKTAQSSLSTKGLINHLFSDINCDLTTEAKLTLDEFNAMIPANMKVNMKGNAEGQIKSVFSMEQFDKMQIDKMKLSGAISINNLDVTYDSLSLKTDQSDITFSLPNTKATSKNTKFLYADIQSKNLEAHKLNSYNAMLKKTHLIMEASDMRDSTRIPDLICSFSMDTLSAGMDTLSLAIAKPAGRVVVFPRDGHVDQPQIRLTASTQQFESHIGKSAASLNKFHVNSEIINQKEQKDIFLKWLVKGSVGMEKGKITMTGFTYPFEIPAIEMAISPETINIKDGRMKIDKSDFSLSGSLKNILSYYRGDSILRGNLNFTSDQTDVLQLMTMTNGIGYDKENADSIKHENETSASGPYMVPKGIDIALNTNIKKATFGKDTISAITGNVRVYDGILLFDEVKLTTPAARMQLTAMYRTPRKNHLFLGIDYHMLDIEIEQLLKMIPDIDTLMPMLRSFRGKGEFHLAVETYLDSTYNLKKSTLRGAASIRGNDLVLMDGETFGEIAKTLKFNRKTENRVDSLSAEFTIFRDEIDVYPFLIVMDKYKAIVGGRHNFDMSFDYHISVVDCPLPIKLGVDVKGTMDNLSYSLAKCKYGELYRPTSRHAVENKQLELRKMIREALTQQVKEP
jgi:hypothetical protein